MPSLYDLSDSVLERVFQFLPLIHPEPHVFMVSITVCSRLWLFLMNWVEESLEDWFYCRRCHRAWERDSDGEVQGIVMFDETVVCGICHHRLVGMEISGHWSRGHRQRLVLCYFLTRDLHDSEGWSLTR